LSSAAAASRAARNINSGGIEVVLSGGVDSAATVFKAPAVLVVLSGGHRQR